MRFKISDCPKQQFNNKKNSTIAFFIIIVQMLVTWEGFLKFSFQRNSTLILEIKQDIQLGFELGFNQALQFFILTISHYGFQV